MSPVPVVWWGEPGKGGCWDHHLVMELLSGKLGEPAGFPELVEYETCAAAQEAGRGAIVHVSLASLDIGALMADTAQLDWVLLIATSDEEHLRDLSGFKHRNARVWRQCPRTDATRERRRVSRSFGHGPPPDGHHPGPPWWPDRDYDWFFAGQVTTDHRRAWFATLAARLCGGTDRGVLVGTPSFLAGIDRDAYLDLMGQARAVPCPAGPGTQCSFRLYEALEAGAVPVPTELRIDGVGAGYWDAVFAEPPPFPIVSDQLGLNDALDRASGDEWLALRTRAWWMREKRQMAVDLVADLDMLGAGIDRRTTVLRNQLTALVTTSPVPANPDHGHLVNTLYTLPRDIEVVLAFDGVRPEQEHLRARYLESCHEMLNRIHHIYGNVVPYVPAGWRHQARLTAEAMAHVVTPAVVFVEHDTPVVGEVPWLDLAHHVNVAHNRGGHDVVRLHFEHQVPEEHRYLMSEYGVHAHDGLPLLSTSQWSQRPHVASTAWYHKMLAREFSEDARTMIEDYVHGRAQQDFDKFRLAIYHPEGSIRRSTHLDTRGEEPKFEMHNHGKPT